MKEKLDPEIKELIKTHILTKDMTIDDTIEYLYKLFSK